MAESADGLLSILRPLIDKASLVQEIEKDNWSERRAIPRIAVWKPFPITKRLPGLDAFCSSPLAGKTIEIDFVFIDRDETRVWADIRVEQGSCLIPTQDGYFRYQPNLQIASKPTSALPERTLTMASDAYYCIELSCYLATSSGSEAECPYAALGLPNIGATNDTDLAYQFPKLDCGETNSFRTIRFKAIFSDDFKGSVGSWHIPQLM